MPCPLHIPHTPPLTSQVLADMTSGPVLATVWEGHGVVAALRGLMGAKTMPDESDTGSVRYAGIAEENLCVYVH